MAKRMTVSDRRHIARVVSMDCIVCRNDGIPDSPAEYHHVRFLGSMGKRAPHNAGIPLCPAHHRTGGKGVAYHAAPWTFEAAYGTEKMLLRQTFDDLGEEYPF